MDKWKTKNHSKFLLLYHVIFVRKYRHDILSNINISNDIKELSRKICNKHNVIIKYVETDKNHIHYMIETISNINLSNLIKTLKSYTTYYIWLKYENILKHYFWKEQTFWTDGYFICSIGSVSKNQLKAYIENQG